MLQTLSSHCRPRESGDPASFVVVLAKAGTQCLFRADATGFPRSRERLLAGCPLERERHFPEPIHMTPSQLPAHASVVVIGGGVMGCSTLYHLAKLGVGDAILI